MALDPLFYEFTVQFPNAVANAIGAGKGGFTAKSLTVKRTEKRSDLFLINRRTKRMILVEPQGYKDIRLYHRMAATMLLYSLQHEYAGKLEAAVIFQTASQWRAAEAFFRQQFAGISTLTFSPRVVILRRIKWAELSKRGDVYLTPLYPLCDVTPTMIKRRAFDWAEQIKAAPKLRQREKQALLGFLAGAISHRLRKLRGKAIANLLGGLRMIDTPLGQEILREGVQIGVKKGIKKGVKEGLKEGLKEGIKEGIPQGAQHVLLQLIATRFGQMPAGIRRKITAIHDTKKLDRIAATLLTAQNMAELKQVLVNAPPRQ